MSPFNALLIVVQSLHPSDGWRCVKLSNNYVTMKHPIHGIHQCRIHSKHVDFMQPNGCAFVGATIINLKK